MKIKKIVAAIAAAAMAVTMTAVNAFAATVTLNSEYAGAWGASATIPKAEFEAIGGDVKVVLTIETKKPLIGEANYLAKPMNICASWDAITFNGITSDTAIAKGDGFFVLAAGQTSLEMVVPESVWSAFVGYEGEEGNGSAGLAFQANDVIIKSAELSAGTPQGEIRTVTEEQSPSIMAGMSYEEATGAAAEEAPAEEATTEEAPAEEATEETTEEAPAEEATTEEAPAVEEEVEAEPAPETSTAPAATGNAPVAAIAVVMALAGAAAVASKKN